MKKSMFALMAVVILGAIVLSACGGAAPTAVQRENPPAAFSGKTNALAGNADAISAGKAEFTTLCATCHGETGAGDGPAASALTPKPANLDNTAKDATDAYIFWRISEGGSMAPFNSAMPAHKDTMSEEQIWQVISYIRTLK
jgi:mono/diheme cytochrome c family protein